MKTRILFVSSVLMLASISFIVFSVYAQKSVSCSGQDGKVYDGRIQPVKGKVTILNHPQLGKTPGSGVELVFQREDCEDCLVAAHTDAEGNYKLLLGVGKYRLIVLDISCDYGGSGCDCYDGLAPDQPRYIDVQRNRPNSAQFDINIVLPKR